MMRRRSRVRFATYNLHACVGTDGRFDPDRTAEALKTLNADIVALQEVSVAHPTEAAINDIAELLPHTDYTVVTAPAIEVGDWQYGNVLLSRYPVLRSFPVDLSVTGREPRSAIEAVIDIPGAPVRVLAAHLGLRAGERVVQAERIAARVQKGDERCLVLGDFNIWARRAPAEAVLRRVLMLDARPATFPARLPTFALDRIFRGAAIKTGPPHVRRDAVFRAASDHLPVVAELA